MAGARLHTSGAALGRVGAGWGEFEGMRVLYGQLRGIKEGSRGPPVVYAGSRGVLVTLGEGRIEGEGQVRCVCVWPPRRKCGR